MSALIALKFIVWSHRTIFPRKIAFYNNNNSGKERARVEERKIRLINKIRSESTPSWRTRISLEATPRREKTRTVEKKQARTTVRRWREIGGLTTAKIEWRQSFSLEARKGGEEKEGCDRIALRLLEPLNIAGRISLAFARPTSSALLDFPRPRFMRNECVSTPLSLPRHRPRWWNVYTTYRISTILLATLDPLLSSRSLKGWKKCWSPSTPPFCSSPPISTFSGEWYMVSDQRVRVR